MSNKHDIVWKLLTSHLSYLEQYHHHKENMANAGFLVQLSLFGTIASANVWPPLWFNKAIAVPVFSSWLVYTTFWMVIHVYIRWQLLNKRSSSIYIKGIKQAQANWIWTKPSKEDLKPHDLTLKTPGKLFKILNRLVVITKYQIEGDTQIKNYPNFIASEILDAAKDGSGAFAHEYLITYSSWFLLLLSSVRIFLG